MTSIQQVDVNQSSTQENSHLPHTYLNKMNRFQGSYIPRYQYSHHNQNIIQLNQINSIELPLSMVTKPEGQLKEALNNHTSQNLFIFYNKVKTQLLNGLINGDKNTLLSYLQLVSETFNPNTYTTFNKSNETIDSLEKLSKAVSNKDKKLLTTLLNTICTKCKKGIEDINDTEKNIKQTDFNEILFSIQKAIIKLNNTVRTPFNDISEQKHQSNKFKLKQGLNSFAHKLNEDWGNSPKSSTTMLGASALNQLNKLTLEITDIVVRIFTASKKSSIKIIDPNQQQNHLNSKSVEHSLQDLKKEIQSYILSLNKSQSSSNNNIEINSITNFLSELKAQCGSCKPTDNNYKIIKQQFQQLKKISKHLAKGTEHKNELIQKTLDKNLISLQNWAKKASKSNSIEEESKENNESKKQQQVDKYLMKALIHVLDPNDKTLKTYSGFNRLVAIELMGVLLSFYRDYCLSCGTLNNDAIKEIKLIQEDLQLNHDIQSMDQTEKYNLGAAQMFSHISNRLDKNQISTHYFGLSGHAITINFSPFIDNLGKKFVDITVFNMWADKNQSYATPKSFRVTREDFNKHGLEGIKNLLLLKDDKKLSLSKDINNILYFWSAVESGFGTSTALKNGKKMRAQKLGTCTMTNLIAALLTRVDGDRSHFDKTIKKLNETIGRDVFNHQYDNIYMNHKSGLISSDMNQNNNSQDNNMNKDLFKLMKSNNEIS